MSREYDSISVERSEDITTVTVDRPEAMNAVNTEMLWELADAMDRATDEARAVVLTGAGDDAFIGGGDIKDFQERSGQWFEENFREAMRAVENAIEKSHTAVIAAVNGIAFGGGTEIAMMADMIIATESAQFGLPEIGLGIIPGCGGTQRLSHLVGYLKAKELVLTGKHISASEAVEIGLANQVIPDDEFSDHIYDLATDLAEGPQLAQGFAKRAINHTRPNLETGLEFEAALASALFDTADKEEGLAAFVEKRNAEFE